LDFHWQKRDSDLQDLAAFTALVRAKILGTEERLLNDIDQNPGFP